MQVTLGSVDDRPFILDIFQSSPLTVLSPSDSLRYDYLKRLIRECGGYRTVVVDPFEHLGSVSCDRLIQGECRSLETLRYVSIKYLNKVLSEEDAEEGVLFIADLDIFFEEEMDIEHLLKTLNLSWAVNLAIICSYGEGRNIPIEFARMKTDSIIVSDGLIRYKNRFSLIEHCISP